MEKKNPETTKKILVIKHCLLHALMNMTQVIHFPEADTIVPLNVILPWFWEDA
jgi:hypothetical protein